MSTFRTFWPWRIDGQFLGFRGPLPDNSVHSSAHGLTPPMLPIIDRGMYEVHGFDATG